MQRIPLVDLDRQYQQISDEVTSAIQAVIDSKKFIQGDFEREFSDAFAGVLGVPAAVGCSNGTDAIVLALRALEVGEGDEVLVPANTFIATAEAVVAVGARPVFVDVSSAGYHLDSDHVEEAVTARTKAIIVVHIFGTPTPMSPIMEVARRRNLVVIEDAAQAHLARYQGQSVGGIGDAGTFSFYPGKNLGAYGDGGAVVSRDPDVVDRVRILLDHGRESKHVHRLVGYNSRMDGLQAAILSVKLRYLESWTKRRRDIAHRYDELLGPQGFGAVAEPPECEGVYHLYVIEVGNRDEVINHLATKGIATGIHYPIPLHLQPAFQYLGYSRGDMPNCERAAERILSLPIFPELTDEEIESIAGAVLEVARP